MKCIYKLHCKWTKITTQNIKLNLNADEVNCTPCDQHGVFPIPILNRKQRSTLYGIVLLFLSLRIRPSIVCRAVHFDSEEYRIFIKIHQFNCVSHLKFEIIHFKRQTKITLYPFWILNLSYFVPERLEPKASQSVLLSSVCGLRVINVDPDDSAVAAMLDHSAHPGFI